MIRALVLTTLSAVAAQFTPGLPLVPEVTVEMVAMGLGQSEEAAAEAAWAEFDAKLDAQCQLRGFIGGDLEVGTEAVSPVPGGQLAEVAGRGACR